MPSSIFALSSCEMITRSEEHTSELQSRSDLVCRLLLEKKKKLKYTLWMVIATQMHSRYLPFANDMKTSRYTLHVKTPNEYNRRSSELRDASHRYIAFSLLDICHPRPKLTTTL